MTPKNLFFLIVVLVGCGLGLSATEDKPQESTITSSNNLDLSIHVGASFFTGPFRDHLQRDGAYLVGPFTELDLSLPIVAGLGLRATLASGAVIHPRSTPIEGTFLYQGIGPVYKFDFRAWGIGLNASIGIQHTTLLVNYYAAGYLEGGLNGWIRLNKELSLILVLSYRHGILPSLLIANQYGLDDIDQIESINVSIGLDWQ